MTARIPPSWTIEDILVAFAEDPDAHRSKLRWWMAVDSWPERETAKLARIGQVAVVA